MKFIESVLAAVLAVLCRAFGVTPERLRDGRRGNLPPAAGGH